MVPNVSPTRDFVRRYSRLSARIVMASLFVCFGIALLKDPYHVALPPWERFLGVAFMLVLAGFVLADMLREQRHERLTSVEIPPEQHRILDVLNKRMCSASIADVTNSLAMPLDDHQLRAALRDLLERNCVRATTVYLASTNQPDDVYEITLSGKLALKHGAFEDR